MKYPFVSIIIPTYNSERFVRICLSAACFQDYPKDRLEVIIVDNESYDNTLFLAKKYSVKILRCHGQAPQVCQQRNLGVKDAKGEYVYILDHDMELPKDFLKSFASEVEMTKGKVDAWYIPEMVVAGNKLISDVRSLEKRFYDDTVISAARLIKKSIFKKVGGYDLNLSGGPADWDMDIQMRLSGAKFGTLKEKVYHHEENLSFWKHIVKKSIYLKGSDAYKEKWKQKNATIYENTVRKQFDPFYRYILVFVEKEKWRKLLLPHFFLFFILFFSKIMVGFLYIINKLKS